MEKQIRGIIGSLSLQFILGMLTNLFGNFPLDAKFSSESYLNKIVFFLHAINGLALPLFALGILILAVKNSTSKQKTWASLGFLSIVLASTSGISTVMFKDNLSEIFSFLMSLGFIIAFISYWKIMVVNDRKI
jgi:hypothetical protein